MRKLRILGIGQQRPLDGSCNLHTSTLSSYYDRDKIVLCLCLIHSIKPIFSFRLA